MLNFLFGLLPGQAPRNADLGRLAYQDSVPRSRVARTANVQWTEADCGKLIDYTSGTFLQTTDFPYLLGVDWWVRLRNTGTGTVTLPTIDGVAAGLLLPGDCVDVICDGAAFYGTKLKTASQYLFVREEQSSGSSGGSAAANSYQTRVLNTVVSNSIAGASLSSNLVTLPAGTYQFIASAPASGNAANGHRLDLYNNTDGTNIHLGASEYALFSAGHIRAHIAGQFTLAGTKAIKLNHFTLVAGGGLGTPVGQSGVNEVYSTLQIWKL